jgi:hypothetical protein
MGFSHRRYAARTMGSGLFDRFSVCPEQPGGAPAVYPRRRRRIRRRRRRRRSCVQRQVGRASLQVFLFFFFSFLFVLLLLLLLLFFFTLLFPFRGEHSESHLPLLLLVRVVARMSGGRVALGLFVRLCRAFGTSCD